MARTFSERVAKANPKAATLHPYEREAIRLLARAGWTQNELGMCFNVSSSTIHRIVSMEGDE